MKKIKLFISICCVSFSIQLLSQSTASTIKYQAVARDADDNVISGKEIGIQFTILNEEIGTEVYSETHETITSSLGVFSLELGGGMTVFGDFETINWSAFKYALEVAIDIEGGTDYKVIGSSSILAVPISLRALKADCADSLISFPQLWAAGILLPQGGSTNVILNGNAVNIIDTDWLNEKIRNVKLEECILYIYEGTTTIDTHSVDFTPIKGPFSGNGDGTWGYDTGSGNEITVGSDGIGVGVTGTANYWDFGVNGLQYSGKPIIQNNNQVLLGIYGEVQSDNIISNKIYVADEGYVQSEEEKQAMEICNNKITNIFDGINYGEGIMFDQTGHSEVAVDKVSTDTTCVKDIITVGSDTSSKKVVIQYSNQFNSEWSKVKCDIVQANEVHADVKNFVMDNPNNKNEKIVYASLEGPEAAAYERGVGKLINGLAEIKFSDHFESVINSKTATIQLTPKHWDTFGLAVVETNDDGFKVKELKNGQGDFEFNWEVKAVRKGYEGYRVVRSKDEFK